MSGKVNIKQVTLTSRKLGRRGASIFVFIFPAVLITDHSSVLSCNSQKDEESKCTVDQGFEDPRPPLQLFCSRCWFSEASLVSSTHPWRPLNPTFPPQSLPKASLVLKDLLGLGLSSESRHWWVFFSPVRRPRSYPCATPQGGVGHGDLTVKQVTSQWAWRLTRLRTRQGPRDRNKEEIGR